MNHKSSILQQKNKGSDFQIFQRRS